jgi:hypothetical protein
MKSAVSLTLIVWIALSGCLGFAQEPAPTRALTIPASPLPSSSAETVQIRKLSSQFAASRSGAVKGAMIGAGIGAVLASTIGQEACLNAPRWHCAAKGGVTLGALGALIGWLR